MSPTSAYPDPAPYSRQDVARCMLRAARGSTAFTQSRGPSMAEHAIIDALDHMSEQRRLLREPVEVLLLRYTEWLARQADVTSPRAASSRRNADELVRAYLRESEAGRQP